MPFAALAVVVIALLSTANALPRTRVSTITRRGRQAELRIINRLPTDSSRFLFVGSNNQSVTLSDASVVVLGRFASGETTIATVGSNSIFPTGANPGFVVVDGGPTNGFNSLVVRVNSSASDAAICQDFTIAPGTRNTIVITGIVSGPSTTQTATCSSGGFCGPTTVTQPGLIEVRCAIVLDTLPSGTQACSTQLKVRFFNFLSQTCPVPALERTDINATGFRLLSTTPLPPGVSDDDFERSERYSLVGSPLWTDGEARFTEVVAADSTAHVVTQQSTAFLNVANAAFKINSSDSGNLDNTFTVVIARSNVAISGSAPPKNTVVHVATVNPGTVMGWIEVPAGSVYTLFVYDGSVSETDIFGDTSQTTDPGSTSPPNLLTAQVATSAALAVNQLAVFRIASTSADGTSSQVAAGVLPLTAAANAASSNFVVWNNIINRDIKLAKPDAECCNYFSNATLLHNGRSQSKNLAASTVFNIYEAHDGCSTIPDPFATINLQRTSSQCEVHGIVIAGRIAPVNVTSSCLDSQCIISTPTVFRVDSASQGINVLSFPVELCQCNAPPSPPPCDTCTEFARLSSKLDSVGASNGASSTTINNNVKAAQAVLSSQVSAVNVKVDRVLKDTKSILKDIDSLADDVGDLEDEIKDN